MIKEDEDYVSKDDIDKRQHVLDLKQKAKNLKIDNKQHHKVKLTDEHKEQLMRCIRWHCLSQDTLLRLSSDPEFVLAKSLIVQGLAIKLGGVDAVKAEDLKLTTQPRRCVRRDMIPNSSIEPIELEEVAHAHTPFPEAADGDFI